MTSGLFQEVLNRPKGKIGGGHGLNNWGGNQNQSPLHIS